MPTYLAVGTEADLAERERAAYATMPAVRRPLPWRIRQQNRAYRLAERAGVPTDPSGVHGAAPRSEAGAHFGFEDQYAEYFFDVGEFEHTPDNAFFLDR